MNRLFPLLAVTLLALTTGSAKAETWYLILSVNAYGSRTEVSVIEMDTQQGCEVAGNKLDREVASNKLENIRNFSYTCIQRQ